MSGPSLQIDSAVHFVVLHAHNGFLEICLELGAAGLVIFLLSWMRAWRKLWPLWREGAIDRIAWPMALLLLVILYDLDENTLLIYNGLFWILYAAALVTAEEAWRDSRHKHLAVPHAMLKLRRYAAAHAPAGNAPAVQPDP
jgi:O-antigen ligase